VIAKVGHIHLLRPGDYVRGEEGSKRIDRLAHRFGSFLLGLLLKYEPENRDMTGLAQPSFRAVKKPAAGF
jgi:hypothetical protein